VMNSLVLLIVLRLLERITAVVIGGLSVYMGYRLFLEVPDINNVEAKITVKEHLETNISKVGPGAIFAIFGIIVVSSSLIRGISFENKIIKEAADGTKETQHEKISGAGSTPPLRVDSQSSVPDSIPEGLFVTLNSLASDLSTDVSGKQKRNIRLAISRSKLALMENSWNEDLWGDQAAFRQWVFKGEPDPPPTGVKEEAILLYRKVGE